MPTTTAPDVTVSVVVGGDTNKDLHVADALGALGRRLAELVVPATAAGYRQLHHWAGDLGQVDAFGVEGTGSHGAGLARYLRHSGRRVIEVNRPDRATRHRKGKSDPIDAEAAARAVLAGTATATPKYGDDQVEVIRILKLTRDSAVKAQTQAVNQLKALLVTAPCELRESLTGLGLVALLERCAALRPGEPTTSLSAAKYALRLLARRALTLRAEAKHLREYLADLTKAAAPALVALTGVGPDTAAAPARRRRQPAPAPQRGCLRRALRHQPHPGLLRKDHALPTQPRRQPPSQRGAAPSCHHAHALARTHQDLPRATHHRGQDQARDHALPQALPRPAGLPLPRARAHNAPAAQ
jgi:hypothetical protein